MGCFPGITGRGEDSRAPGGKPWRGAPGGPWLGDWPADGPRRACPPPSAPAASTGRALGPQPRPDSRAEPTGQREGCPQDARCSPRSHPMGEPVSLPGSTDPPRRAAPTPAPRSLAQYRVSARIQVCQGGQSDVGLLPLLPSPRLSTGDTALSMQTQRWEKQRGHMVFAEPGISLLDFLRSSNPRETEISPPCKGSHGLAVQF